MNPEVQKILDEQKSHYHAIEQLNLKLWKLQTDCWASGGHKFVEVDRENFPIAEDDGVGGFVRGCVKVTYRCENCNQDKIGCVKVTYRCENCNQDKIECQSG
jgi:hypothetical protein